MRTVQCSDVAKYPFNPTATVEATAAEVNGLLRKPDGALWVFYNQSLQKLVVKQGSLFASVLPEA